MTPERKLDMEEQLGIAHHHLQHQFETGEADQYTSEQLIARLAADIKQHTDDRLQQYKYTCIEEIEKKIELLIVVAGTDVPALFKKDVIEILNNEYEKRK